MRELPPGWDATIIAPWTTEQVDNLNRFQLSGLMHPFTCARCSPHATLVAATDGWHCPNGCDYEQTWATAYMADPSVLDLLRWPL